jgi:hypothetical protein
MVVCDAREVVFGRVSLQEPVLRSIALRFGWTLPPRYPEVRGLLTEILVAAVETVDDWFWDATDAESSVFAWNEEERMHATVEPMALELVNELPNVEALNEVAQRCLGPCLDTLNLPAVTNVGCAATWMMAAESTSKVEKELETWLCSPSFRTRMAPFGSQPDDLTIYARFESDGGVGTSIKTEPVTDEQAAEGGFFLSRLTPSEFPPAALVTSIQRWQDVGLASDQGTDRAAELLEQLLPLGFKLLATIDESDEQLRD